MQVKDEIKGMKDDIRKTYGAYSSLQSQMHNIFGDVQEIEGLLKSLLSVFNDLKNHFSEAMDSKIKLENKKGESY
jgi:hypothetical protein